MNRRTKHIIREKVNEHEQLAGVEIDTSALWNRLKEMPTHPVAKKSRTVYFVAAAVVLGMILATGVVFRNWDRQPERPITSSDKPGNMPEAIVPTKPPATVDDHDIALTRETTVPPRKDRLHVRDAKTGDVKAITEYLKHMDVPTMACLYAGKENDQNGEENYAGKESDNF